MLLAFFEHLFSFKETLRKDPYRWINDQEIHTQPPSGGAWAVPSRVSTALPISLEPQPHGKDLLPTGPLISEILLRGLHIFRRKFHKGGCWVMVTIRDDSM